jgi:hypothetical protein
MEKKINLAHKIIILTTRKKHISFVHEPKPSNIYGKQKKKKKKKKLKCKKR